MGPSSANDGPQASAFVSTVRPFGAPVNCVRLRTEWLARKTAETLKGLGKEARAGQAAVVAALIDPAVRSSASSRWARSTSAVGSRSRALAGQTATT